MKIENGYDGGYIPDNGEVSVYVMNHIVEAIFVRSKKSGLNKIKKISKEEYVFVDSGEIMEYQLSKNRSENTASLKKSFSKIRHLINNNFKGGRDEIHLVLTYPGANMKDSKKLYIDFDKFWKRWKRKYGDNYLYIAVPEPHEKEGWHLHVLMKTRDGTRLFIPWEDIKPLWGQGGINVDRLDKIDNIGAYLSGYFCDVEATPEDIKRLGNSELLKEVIVDGKKKKFIKGQRLHLYPVGMNLVRHSRDIKYPEKQKMTYEELKKIVGNCAPHYTKRAVLKDDEDHYLNDIVYENYNMKRSNLFLSVANVKIS